GVEWCHVMRKSVCVSMCAGSAYWCHLSAKVLRYQRTAQSVLNRAASRPVRAFSPPPPAIRERVRALIGWWICISQNLFSRQDWRGPEGQALKPVRQQAQLCARANLVKTVNDVLDHSAVRPSGFQQLLRCGIRRRLASHSCLFSSWHCCVPSSWSPHPRVTVHAPF